MNTYFTVVGERGFRVFRHLGTSPSNSYVGASRVINRVMEAITTRADDEIHALVGGTFMVRDGLVSPISLRAPKPVFEKNYGRYEPDASIMRHYVRRGLAVDIPEPTIDVDYAAAVSEVSNNRLPELHDEIVHVDDSPELADMKNIVANFMTKLDEEGMACEVRWADVDAHEGARFDLVIDDVRIRFAAGRAHGVFSVEVPETFVSKGNKDPIVHHGRKIHYFRNVDGIADPLAASGAFLMDCGREIASNTRRMGI